MGSAKDRKFLIMNYANKAVSLQAYKSDGLPLCHSELVSESFQVKLEILN